MHPLPSLQDKLREVGLPLTMWTGEKGIGWRETMRARGWQESPGHWLVSTPTAPATVPQTPHLTHRSEGVKFFIKAHEQVCPGHRLLDKGE